MPTWAYKEVEGKVEKRVIAVNGFLRGSPRPPRHASEGILGAYYAQECEQGSRFRSGYTKNQIKRVHERALQRFEQLGQES